MSYGLRINKTSHAALKRFMADQKQISGLSSRIIDIASAAIVLFVDHMGTFLTDAERSLLPKPEVRKK
jgi:hypothetical protein